MSNIQCTVYQNTGKNIIFQGTLHGRWKHRYVVEPTIFCSAHDHSELDTIPCSKTTWLNHSTCVHLCMSSIGTANLAINQYTNDEWWRAHAARWQENARQKIYKQKQRLNALHCVSLWWWATITTRFRFRHRHRCCFCGQCTSDSEKHSASYHKIKLAWNYRKKLLRKKSSKIWRMIIDVFDKIRRGLELRSPDKREINARWTGQNGHNGQCVCHTIHRRPRVHRRRHTFGSHVAVAHHLLPSSLFRLLTNFF